MSTIYTEDGPLLDPTDDREVVMYADGHGGSEVARIPGAQFTPEVEAALEDHYYFGTGSRWVGTQRVPLGSPADAPARGLPPMTSMPDALAALERTAGPTKQRDRDRRSIILRTVLHLDGTSDEELVPDDLDLDDVAAHPERSLLERASILRFEAPPDYEPPRAEGG